MTDTELEFRPVGPDHRDTFRAYVDYAFDPTDGPQDHDDELDRVGDGFGLFVDEDLRSICVHYGFETYLRGEWVPLAGLGAVATPPEHRRNGHVRRMVEESLDRWRDEFPLAALWPFSRSYYEQFGWATANTTYKYQVPLAQLSFARGTADGRPKRVTADDWAALNEAYEAHVADETLGIRRDERWWRERVLGDDEPYVYAWERDGEVRGYVAYSFESTGDGMGDRRIDVAGLAAADDHAFRGLLGFLADHDSQAGEAKLYAPDDTLLDRVPTPGDVACDVHTGPMVRVVDVAGALSAMPYPDGATADLTLAVTDDTVPWNDGVFTLDVSAGGTDCTPTDALEAGDADVTVDVGTLSQLVVGYRDVTDLRRVGELSVTDESVAATLAGLFPPETVALRDFF
jgi:predicted acetyltransferase